MTEDLAEKALAVVQAARRWSRSIDATDALLAAVDALEAALAPSPAEARSRPWSQVYAGWSVQAPNGAWYEVLDTSGVSGRQHVTLRVGFGQTITSVRPAAALVVCRPGPARDATDAALAVLEGAGLAEAVLKDSPPWE